MLEVAEDVLPDPADDLLARALQQPGLGIRDPEARHQERRIGPDQPPKPGNRLAARAHGERFHRQDHLVDGELYQVGLGELGRAQEGEQPDAQREGAGVGPGVGEKPAHQLRVVAPGEALLLVEVAPAHSPSVARVASSAWRS
ncbi:hypothetical protein D3C87_1571130 [compost metagenome]